MSSELTKRAMLVTLHIKHFSDVMTDKEVTRVVAENAGVNPKVGKYMKNVLPKHALKKIKNLKASARETHASLTMPWDDTGVRLLPTDMYDKYEREMRQHYEDFQEEIRILVTNYEDYKNEASQALGPMYKEEDYPLPGQLSDKFEFTWHPMPVPDASHFVADLPEIEKAKLQNSIEQQIVSRIQGTVHDLYQRMGKAVANLAERLELDENGKPRTFQKATIGNLLEMCDVIPRLNITNDPELAKMCVEIKQAISDIDPSELRRNSKSFDEDKFNVTKEKLSDINNRFMGYFGTMPGLEEEKTFDEPSMDVDDLPLDDGDDVNDFAHDWNRELQNVGV